MKQVGFTLIELLVTIAVAVILATVAIPNFQSMMVRNSLTTNFNQVLTAMHFARSEAAKKRGEVTVSLTSGGDGAGWRIEVWKGEVGALGTCQAETKKCLKVVDESFSKTSVTTVPASGKVTFNALGRAPSSCPVETPCSISIEHANLQGDPEIVKINSLGNIYRPGA